MRRRAVCLIVSVLLAGPGVVAGCGGASTSDEVKAKVQQFVDSVRTGDYHTLCNEVLAPALIEHIVAAGLQCEQAMSIALQGVKGPTLLIGRITVRGNDASAITLSGAKNETASLDAVQLVRTSAGWRVKSLGAPIAPPGKASGAGAGAGTATTKGA